MKETNFCLKVLLYEIQEWGVGVYMDKDDESKGRTQTAEERLVEGFCLSVGSIILEEWTGLEQSINKEKWIKVRNLCVGFFTQISNKI